MRLMASVLISKWDSQTRNAGTKKAPFLGLCGVPGATRTPGLSLRRRSLYPTELREHGLWEVALGECTSSTLGGGRSILLSYGRMLYKVINFHPRDGKLGGDRSILLRYGNIFVVSTGQSPPLPEPETQSDCIASTYSHQCSLRCACMRRSRYANASAHPIKGGSRLICRSARTLEKQRAAANAVRPVLVPMIPFPRLIITTPQSSCQLRRTIH